MKDHPMCNYCAPWLPRIGFGLVLIGYGVNHYINITEFADMAAVPVGALGPVAYILAFIFPGLMILGGALFAVKQMGCCANLFILASFGGIMGWAGLAVLLGANGGDMMLAITNASILLVTYYAIKKIECCSGSSCYCESCDPSKKK